MPPDVKHVAKLYTERSIRKLWSIAEDIMTPALVKVAACNALLDRGWGKPAQPIDAVVTNKFELMSDDALGENIQALITKAGGPMIEGVRLPDAQVPFPPECVPADPVKPKPAEPEQPARVYGSTW